MGSVAGTHYGNGHANFNQANLGAQGSSIGSSFSGNDISHTTNINNFNHYGSTRGYHANAYGANGYHPYGGYGAYHPYAAGYGAAITGAGDTWCLEWLFGSSDVGPAPASMLTSFLGLTMMAGHG